MFQQAPYQRILALLLCRARIPHQLSFHKMLQFAWFCQIGVFALRLVFVFICHSFDGQHWCSRCVLRFWNPCMLGRSGWLSTVERLFSSKVCQEASICQGPSFCVATWPPAHLTREREHGQSEGANKGWTRVSRENRSPYNWFLVQSMCPFLKVQGQRTSHGRPPKVQLKRLRKRGQHDQRHAEGGATRGGGKQMQANANKCRQTMTDASKSRGDNTNKSKWTRANADKRKQTLTPLFIAVFLQIPLKLPETHEQTRKQGGLILSEVYFAALAKKLWPSGLSSARPNRRITRRPGAPSQES